VFRRFTGLTPQTYLRLFDQAHLTREFKKIHGLTPGRFARAVNY
jgi:AraC-like DNA-binding protein